MCASSLILCFTLIAITIAILSGMGAEGLPLGRQERGTSIDEDDFDKGILAGADFLSMFIDSSYRHRTDPPTTTTPEPLDRATRSTSNYLTTIAQLDDESTTSAQEQSSDSSDGVVVAVHVSSSVRRTLKESETTTQTYEEISDDDQNFVASEEHPSIVAEANKSEFNVEESEPITTNGDDYPAQRSYPAAVQALPRNSDADYLQKKLQTVIYHNGGPREKGRARSVSYSTVIQAVPHLDKQWDNKERRYGNSQYLQNFEASNSSLETSTPHHRPHFTTERNWEVPEVYHQQVPRVYGRPEQNYEVDESASVMSNGRVHGVQPTPIIISKEQQEAEQKKKDEEKKLMEENQKKVGYVVEGRNYRKYRVEERTSDGFIVGEYGVVSHDDGSLRGVRYTADGTINPRLIYDALMKFLSL